MRANAQSVRRQSTPQKHWLRVRRKPGETLNKIRKTNSAELLAAWFAGMDDPHNAPPAPKPETLLSVASDDDDSKRALLLEQFLHMMDDPPTSEPPKRRRH
jgi:hypothetical protein